MTPNIYPFRVYAHDNGHVVTSDALAKKLWVGRPKDAHPNVHYYAVELAVKGPTSVTVEVYDMLCSVYGGLGVVICKYDPDLAQDDLTILRGHIRTQQELFAAKEFQRRLTLQDAAAIEAVRQEFFGELP